MTKKNRKTAYDKILPLVQISPNSAYIKTALRHFSNEALLRELQRRNALPGNNCVTGVSDAELIEEFRSREMSLLDRRALRDAIDRKDWHAVESVYFEME